MNLSMTLMKTCTYAMMHMVVAVNVAYLLSGSWKIAFAIGLIEPMVQTFCFFFHERAWHKIERRMKVADHHDEVIDSVSPFGRLIERLLRRK